MHTPNSRTPGPPDEGVALLTKAERRFGDALPGLLGVRAHQLNAWRHRGSVSARAVPVLRDLLQRRPPEGDVPALVTENIAATKTNRAIILGLHAAITDLTTEVHGLRKDLKDMLPVALAEAAAVHLRRLVEPAPLKRRRPG